MDKKRWYTVEACKAGGFQSVMGYFVPSRKEARRLHQESHRGWVIVHTGRSTDEELRENIHGYEMTEQFYGR